MEDRKERIDWLVKRLNDASRAYYQEAEEIMPNIEYDALYDELLQLEKETGYVPDDSPSHNVGYEIVSKLPKERHPSRMLSLDKTKSREELRDWLKGREGLLSWKMDGLTIVLTYDGGRLVKALTRGNGDVGEVITNNAKEFENVPVTIPFKGHAVLRGEAVIRYSDFEKINASIPNADAKYKNPRNLCSGSVRQLDPAVTKKRHVYFMAFTLVEAEGVDFHDHRHEQMDWMKEQGFDVVFYKFVNPDNILDTIEWFAQEIVHNDFPSDGLVLTYEDMAYGRSLGTTAKYPLDSLAFKWADTKEETTLRKIEWSASRTGLINPVAVFDPVELEGTTVSRASVHNVSIMEQLGLGIGDRITVYKANMIIPQIAEDLTPSGNVEIPSVCPVCGCPTKLKDEEGVRTLYCLNPDCAAKQIKSFALFVSRNAMDIEGLSEETIEKLIDIGVIHDFADLFRFDEYRDAVVEMKGFGEKSFENLRQSIEAARRRTPDRLLMGLGIPGIGSANARLIAKFFHNKWDRMRGATKEELLQIDGVGDVLADAYTAYFKDPKKQKIVDDLMNVLELDETDEAGDSFLAGKTFVITGSLNHYENRDQLKEELESAGAKVAGSVSSRTSYLINNDLTSASGKNKKAK
ncbi:MAG: NAD-dependent DNA ligase LigA, partial [Eubacteriales bacterium]|nr:NAD-dependent DNA ligase LigA [Eubacteriales bacterium]